MRELGREVWVLRGGIAELVSRHIHDVMTASGSGSGIERREREKEKRGRERERGMGHDGSPVAEAEGESRIENRGSILNKDLQRQKFRWREPGPGPL